MVAEYAVIAVISVVLIVLYHTLIKVKEFWLGLLFVCVAIVNIGYFMLSLAKSVGFAIFANDVAYFGSVFLSMCMFLTIAKLCGFAIKKPVVSALLACASVMFLIVATSGILPWYYKSVSLESVDGVTVFVKEYGVLHSLYLVYLVSYFAAMITVISISAVKKKGVAQKFAGALAFIVLVNLFVWFFEKFGDRRFEFLSVSYVVSEILFVMLYWMMQDYVPKTEVQSIMSAEKRTHVIDLASMPMSEKIEKVLSYVKSGENLATREREILELMLDNKRRKEIAEHLCLSENTVKTYTRTLYSKLGVTSREELYAILLQE